jgi:hypothetical protein
MPNMTLAQFAQHITRAAHVMPQLEERTLRISGARLARISRSYIGHYQNFSGPFGAWAPLSVNTLLGGVSPTGYHYRGKIELGFSPPDNPLLRTGALRDSIDFTVEHRAAIIGSPDPVARYQEFGTQNTPRHIAIPPRPFIGPAVYVHGWDEVQRVARIVFHPLLTGRP